MTESLYIDSPLLKRHGITALFSLRGGGVSLAPFESLNLGHNIGDTKENVAENLHRLCEAAAIDEPHRAEQVHGCSILECQGAGRQHPASADILVSAQPGIAVAVRTADCLPLLLAAPKTGLVAAVHAGWRGTQMQAARIAVEALIRKGGAAEEILASLGPCIGPCCFEVGREVAEALTKNQPDADIGKETDGRFHPNLAAINRQQLLLAGLIPSHIEQIDLCTSCLPQHFFSHRRDEGRTGRHLAVVALPSAT